MKVTKEGSRTIVELLLKKEANINAQNNQRNIALIKVVRKKYKGSYFAEKRVNYKFVVRLLLKKETDINIKIQLIEGQNLQY